MSFRSDIEYSALTADIAALALNRIALCPERESLS
jgi:hypothetical protein